MPRELLAAEEELDGELCAAALRNVRPWKDCWATSEISPARPTAPAIIQRFMREIRTSPRSRALIEAFPRSRALIGAFPATGASSARGRRTTLTQRENALIR
jgi:hypothetical protein